MSRTNSGSGNASRIGNPTMARPGNVSRIVSLTASHTCSGPRCNVTVNARVPAGSPDALTASLPVGAPISDPSPLGRLPVQQRIIAPDRDISGGTEHRSTVTHHIDPTTVTVPERTGDWESIGEIIARLRG